MSDTENLVAEFEINNVELEAEYELSENQHIDADFVINAAPEKVSQLENDLNFQTQEQVQEAIQAESDVINARIDTEVETLNERIDDIQEGAITEIIGEGNISATQSGHTVTITSTTYTHTQAVASKVWTINHNLNKNPTVTPVDSADEVQLPSEISYDSNNTVTVKFLSEFAGKAYLN